MNVHTPGGGSPATGSCRGRAWLWLFTGRRFWGSAVDSRRQRRRRGGDGPLNPAFHREPGRDGHVPGGRLAGAR